MNFGTLIMYLALPAYDLVAMPIEGSDGVLPQRSTVCPGESGPLPFEDRASTDWIGECRALMFSVFLISLVTCSPSYRLHYWCGGFLGGRVRCTGPYLLATT